MQCSGRDATRALASWRDEALAGIEILVNDCSAVQMEARARAPRTQVFSQCFWRQAAAVIVLQIQRAEDHPQPQVSSQTVVHIYHYVASCRLQRFKAIPSSDRPISQSSHAFCAKKFSDLVRIAGSKLF